jgi:hypothetical protein
MASARDQFSCDEHFGENLQNITEQVSIKFGETVADLEKGDFNGDGLKDKIVILRLNKKSRFDNGVTLLNSSVVVPNDRKPEIQSTNTNKILFPKKDTIALGIIQSNATDKKCHKFVFYNTDYFPAFEAKRLFVRVLPVGDKGSHYADVQKLVIGELRYDAIYLSSGPTGIIYWSNGKYTFELPYGDPELSED